MARKNKGNKGYVTYPPDRPEGQPQASLISAQRTEIRSAPIPDPSELQRYRDMDPALYDVIKHEFQANSAHRREMERLHAQDRNIIVRAASRNDAWGIVVSSLFAFASLGMGAYFVYTGRQIGALLGILGLLPATIGAFRRKT